MKVWLTVLALAALSIAGVLALRKKTPVAQPPVDLRVFFTCDTRGRLVPCGCFTGQYGGLTRLKTVLDQAPSTNTIRVDVGDAIQGREDFELIQYRYLLKAYASMRFDALNVGQREAQLSADQLRALRQETPVPILSANLLDASGAPVFEPYRLVERGGHRIALVGVLDPRGLGENLGAGLTVERMEVTLGKLLPDLRGKADLIVLLAFTDEATLAALAREFYELDVILGGKVSQPAQKLETENRSLILYVTNESRALGMLKFKLAGRGKLENPAHEIMLMHEEIPQDKSIAALATDYRDEIRRTRLAIDDPSHLQADSIPGVRNAAAFAGTESCVSCHKTAAAAWEKTGHAGAFDTLVNAKADADPNCIGCHTVGFGTPSGYRREFAAQKLVNVGCESCHGPGSLHVEQYRSGAPVTFKFRPLGAGDCQKCHHGEFSRPFDWDRFWPHVKHGKEPARTATNP
ncbi:MAG: multiheme c-type cytochrome [Verrucomicrobiota bacterium]